MEPARQPSTQPDSSSSDQDHDENEEEGEYEMDSLNFHSLLESFFTEQKKNRNMVDVLVEIKRSLETHNRIMLKMYQHMSSSS